MANTIKDLSVGEWLQSDLINSKNYSDDNLKEVSLLKTSSIIKWCLIAPMLYKNYSGEILELANSFGEKFGLAFQYIDDCLDYEDGSDKDKLLDLKNNQITKVTFEYLKKDPKLFSSIKNSTKKLTEVKFDDVELKKSVQKVREESVVLLNECKDILNNIFKIVGTPEEHPYRKIIIQVCDELKTRKN